MGPRPPKPCLPGYVDVPRPRALTPYHLLFYKYSLSKSYLLGSVLGPSHKANAHKTKAPVLLVLTVVEEGKPDSNTISQSTDLRG